MRLPHTRGGVSLDYSPRHGFIKSSPHTWGCFRYKTKTTPVVLVFPTHVGVFLIRRERPTYCLRLPHTRGGVSFKRLPRNSISSSSPHTWGCFHKPLRLASIGRVFPTHVGVFPSRKHLMLLPKSLPHTRGGVSRRHFGKFKANKSSPHTWGCFSRLKLAVAYRNVFPTHVGVFPVWGSLESLEYGLPHTRGGVSVVKRFGDV